MDSGEQAYRRGDYAAAQHAFAAALMAEKFGPDDTRLALNLFKLAEVDRVEGNYAAAESLQQRSLAIRKRALGPMHIDVAESLDGLARVYHVLGRYDEAESLYQRCLTILLAALGSDDPRVAIKLNNLATVYRDQGKADQAEVTFRRSLWIMEHASRSTQSDIKHVSRNLGRFFWQQGRYAEAVPLLWRGLDSAVQTLLPFTAVYFIALGIALKFNGKLNAREPSQPKRWTHFIWKCLLVLGTVFMIGSLVDWRFSRVLSSERGVVAVGALLAWLLWVTVGQIIRSIAGRRSRAQRQSYPLQRRITNGGLVFYAIALYVAIIGYGAGPWAAAHTALGVLMSATALGWLFVYVTVCVAAVAEYLLGLAGIRIFRIASRKRFPDA